MKTIKSTSGRKAVNISIDGTGSVRAMYVQIYDNEEQVIEAKTFASIKNAEKWANKILN